MNKAELTAELKVELKVEGFKDHHLAGTGRLVKYQGLDLVTISWGSVRVFVRIQHPDGADDTMSVSINHPHNYELIKKFIEK